MKRCAKCHAWKPLDAFYRDKNRADGRTPYCKPCQYISKNGGVAGPGCGVARHLRRHVPVLDAFRLTWWGAPT